MLADWRAADHPDSEITLPPCNGYLRRALHENIDALELDESFMRETRKGPDGDQLVVMKLSEEAKAEKDAAIALANKVRLRPSPSPS